MTYDMFKILLVDDDEVILRLYERFLNRSHYQVITARSGEEALRLAFQEAPDVILLDLMMPKMDGYAVCTRLRQTPGTADIPIMIVTSLDRSTARQKAREVGADDFVSKSEPLDNVEGRIKMLLKQRTSTHTRSWLADLPGSVAADYALRSQLATGKPFAVLYLDLDNFFPFGEQLGFEEAERLLWQVARLLVEKVSRRARGEFVGYYGLDDFILLTDFDQAAELAAEILVEFNHIAGECLEWRNDIPWLRIAVIEVRNTRAIHPGQIASLGKMLLGQAKAERCSTVKTAQI